MSLQTSSGKKIVEDTGWIDLELADGVRVGKLTGTPQCRRIGKHVYIRGSVGFTAQNTPLELCVLPKDFCPLNNMYKFTATGGNTVARTYYTSGGAIGCDWIIHLLKNNVLTGNVNWYDLHMDYLVD